jgi:hypothetical protein
MSFAFEKLVVYQKAVAFADAACSPTKDFPRGYFFLADRVNRAPSMPLGSKPWSFKTTTRPSYSPT